MGKKIKLLIGHSGIIKRKNRKRIFRIKKIGAISLLNALMK
jgi:hypothetical protein